LKAGSKGACTPGQHEEECGLGYGGHGGANDEAKGG
jgi:hypothetical protein